MGLLAQAVAERKSFPVDQLWASIINAGYLSKAGPNVTLDNAFKVGVLFAGLRVLAQGCAQVPFKLLREVESDGLRNIQPAKRHYLYDLLGVQPNGWTTSFEFRETMIMHAALGNAYAFKNVLSDGTVYELILLNPCRVRKLQAADWTITYEVTGQSGERLEFPASAIWHVRGPSWDGSLGLDVLNLAREALGLAIATEESHAKLHAKGVRASGTYSVDGNLGAEQYKQLKDWITKEFSGADNAGAPMILDRGAKWISQAMTGIDAQHLETRKYQVEEVCRFLGISPMMVFYSDKTSTFASAEAFFEAHVRHSLGPWYSRIEQSADVHLLTKSERARGFYFKFMAEGLLRGTTAARADYYSKALGAGGSPAWMSQDEVRALEDLNPFGGDAGELPVVTNAPKPKNDDGGAAVKAIQEDWERKFSAVKAQQPSVNVTVNQEPISVKVDPVTLNHTIEAKESAQSAPVVNVQNDIHVPAGPAPVVNNTVNVPQDKAPDVVVNVPQQPAPNVTLEATLPTLNVTATLPPRKSISETKISRNVDGEIVKSVTESVEKDAQ